MTEGGSIINITSIEAHQAGPGFGIYAAMKTAVESISKSLALELGGRRIRVNSIAPDGQPSGGEKAARKAMLDSSPEYMPAFLPPLGYFGAPEDSAGSGAVPGQRPVPLHQRLDHPRRRRATGRRAGGTGRSTPTPCTTTSEMGC